MNNNFSSSVTGMFLLTGSILLMQSCKKFVEIPLPKDQVESAIVFSNEQTANAAVAGLYSQMLITTLSISNGGLTVYPGLSADELHNTSANSDLDPFYNNAVPATNSNGIGSRLWSAAYKYIYATNAILEGLDSSASLSVSFKTPLIAEVHLIRAFLYHYLVNLFGDVPLVTTTDYNINATLPRTPAAEIYDQVMEDLKQAYNDLPAAYITTSRARPNKYTAAALLARIYLYKQDWANAEAMASAVINAGMYSLEATLNNVFLSSSNETIWQLSKDAGNTTEGSTFIPSSSSVKPAYVVSNYLLAAFEAGDLRKTNWLKLNTVGGQPYYYPYKYKSRTASPIMEGYIVVRFAEMFLIRAEAETHLNDLGNAAADLNMVRNRANLPNTTAADQPNLLIAVEQERRVELFAEWGHRWFDLKRTGRADAVLGAEKSGWQPADALYPIPQNELLRNVFLIQNPGY